MNNDNPQDLTPEQEQAIDELFYKELEEYVSNLAQPSPEDIALYNKKIDFMDKISPIKFSTMLGGWRD